MIPVSGFLTPPHPPTQSDDPVHTTIARMTIIWRLPYYFEGELTKILEHLFMP